MDPREQTAITPLRSGWRAKAAPQYLPFGFQLKHRRLDVPVRKAESRCEFVDARRSDAFHPALHDRTCKRRCKPLTRPSATLSRWERALTCRAEPSPIGRVWPKAG